MEGIDFENRKFKLWYYHISHREALIRSVKDDNFDRNIDVYFGDVDYIEIPSILFGLSIDKATKKDVIYLSCKTGKEVVAKNIQVLVSNGKRYYIIASVINVMENTLEMLEIPFPTFIKNVKE